MMRYLPFVLALAALVPVIGERLSAHDWLIAVPLICLLALGLWFISPGASASPVPASTTEDSVLARENGR